MIAHSQYVNGYTDGKFRPGRQVTRAEAAQMLLRMMMDQSHGSFPRELYRRTGGQLVCEGGYHTGVPRYYYIGRRVPTQ